MSEDKERYATIGTWVEVFREEGVATSETLLRSRVRAAGLIGETARSKVGKVVRGGFYAESAMRQACSDILNPIDIIHFQNPDNLRADLIAFAEQLGDDKTPLDLSTGNTASLSIICRGRPITGESYIRTAAMSLGYARTSKEVRSKQAEIIDRLFKLAGFDIFDRDYFQDPHKVKTDLMAFAVRLGEGKTPFDINAGNLWPLSTTCQNGRSLSCETYVKTAAVALGFARDNRSSKAQIVPTLKQLLKTAGYDVFDADYFKDAEKVRFDFAAFAQQLGEGKTLFDVTPNTVSLLSITCQNGQVMKGATYFNTATIALGFANSVDEAQAVRAKALKQLRDLVGCSPIDKDYFQDSSNVQADLTAFSRQLGDDNNALDLSTSNIGSLSIVCQNGQQKSGYVYLSDAAIAFDFAKSAKGTSSVRAQTLKHLFKFAGFRPLDQDYFRTSDDLRADFEAFAVQLKKGKRRSTISTGTIGALSIVCQNGQTMKGRPYFLAAAKAYGFAESAKDFATNGSQIIHKLKEIAGFLTPSDDQ